MKIQSVAIDQVHADPANLRKHPERNLAAIKASLARFGQQRPILVDSSGVCRAGNGTLAAARELGWTKIDIVRTDLKGSEATAYAIADNRTAELAEWDQTGLAETLRALESESFDLDAVGFTADEIDALCERLGGEIVDDAAGEWEGMPEFEQPDQMPHRTIHMHFDDDQAVMDFARIIGQSVSDKTKSLWYPERKPRKPTGEKYFSDESPIPDLHH
jgi:ParB-like chromosome segregation protein Spo0J